MPQVSSTRFLGIIVDQSLSWKEQTDWVSRKINKSIGIIRRVSHLVTPNYLLTLYYSLIYPYLSYCNIVWASTFPSTLYKILVLQKRFVRIATPSHTSHWLLYFKNYKFLLFTISIFLKYVFLFIRSMQVKGIFRSISRLTLKQILGSIPTQLVNLQIFILLNFLLVEVNFQ